MFKRPRTDFWAVGVVRERIEALTPARLHALRETIAWLPAAGPWRYLADPFGLVRGDALHVFVEAFDYRRKHAVVERHELALADLRWRGARTVLARDFHLSYPFVVEHAGETWMIPESNHANEIALYRAGPGGDLDTWTRDRALLPGVRGADASPIRHGGRWWMFYSVVAPGGRDQRELHVAHAEDLAGPWQPLPANPILVDAAGARPAGRPFVAADGHVVLPVQDCTRGYGSALRLLRFTTLVPGHVACEPVGGRYTGDLASDDHAEGLHTLSACGEFTLLDVKRIDRSRTRQWLDLKRRARRLVGAAPVPG